MPIEKKKSGVKIEIMADKSVGKADDARIRKLLAECFAHDAAAFAQCRKWHSDPAYVLVTRRAKAVTGHVAVILRDVACGRNKICIAGIQSLAVGPGYRGKGLSQALMTEAMAEAWRRKVTFGLLFCVPELERFYASLGWKKIDAPIFMRGASNRKEPLPAKNIGMSLQLTHVPFPGGAVDLCGRDW